MGLDITAYERAVEVSDHEHDAESDECINAGHIQAYVLKGFERSLAGLTADSFYECSGGTAHFYAGYGGYGHLRKLIAEAVNVDIAALWADDDPDPRTTLIELLDFADNEGTIGPVAAAKIARELRQYEEQIRTRLSHEPRHEQLAERFNDLVACFELAADTGLVQYS